MMLRTIAGSRLISPAAISVTQSVAAVRQMSSGGGLSFELSDEQLQLRDAAQRFVREEIIPNAANYDREAQFPWPLVKKAHENGFANVVIPTEYGGLGLGMVASVLLSETLGYGCTGFATGLMGNDLASTPLILFGSKELKKRFLPRLIEEPIMGAMCVTEPSAGSDISSAKTKAEKKGDEWVINGNKMWITNGGVASFYFVVARTDTDPQTPVHKAFTAFMVEADAPGVSRGKKEMNMGQRCSDTRGITFEDVRVRDADIVGAVGQGYNVAMGAFDRTRPLVAGMAIGLSARALDESAKYSLERKTFGVPIAQHQAVSFMLADMAMNLELSRLMTYRSARELDVGSGLGSYFASIAKCFAADTANQTATNAVQIFGGNGFNSEYPVEKLMRDAKIFQIYEGTSQIQRIHVSRQLFQRLSKTGTASVQ